MPSDHVHNLRRVASVLDAIGLDDSAAEVRAAADTVAAAEAVLRRIVESGAYPEAAIAAEALGGAK